MAEKRNLYMTDAEYLDLLKRARARLDKIKKIYYEDSRVIGDKYTETNVGLCDDSLCTKEIAMWPEEFGSNRPQGRAMKYRDDHSTGIPRHPCPLDGRLWGEGDALWQEAGDDEFRLSRGCFYECKIFQGSRKHPITLKRIKTLFNRLIARMEKELGGD